MAKAREERGGLGFAAAVRATGALRAPLARWPRPAWRLGRPRCGRPDWRQSGILGHGRAGRHPAGQRRAGHVPMAARAVFVARTLAGVGKGGPMAGRRLAAGHIPPARMRARSPSLPARGRMPPAAAQMTPSASLPQLACACPPPRPASKSQPAGAPISQARRRRGPRPPPARPSWAASCRPCTARARRRPC